MFCKNARTMLAMASASPAPTEKIASRPSFPSVPVPVQHWPANSESLLAVEAFPSQNKTSTTPVHSAPATLAPFENVVTLELLERQMAFMQQQKAQANRLLIERAMIMQQQLQREQVNHAQLLSRLGLAQAPPAQPAAPRQPSNNRASAA